MGRPMFFVIWVVITILIYKMSFRYLRGLVSWLKNAENVWSVGFGKLKI